MSYYSIIIIIGYFVNIAITLVKSNTLHWMHYWFLAWGLSSSFACSGQKLLWIRSISDRLHSPVLLHSKSQIHLHTFFNKLHVADSLLKGQDLFSDPKTLPAFSGGALFFTMFTTALHWLLSWVRWVHCTPAHSISLRIASILFSHLLVVYFIQVSQPNLYKCFSFPCPVRHNCIDLTALIILDKNCRSGSYSLCSFFSLLSVPPSSVNF